MMSGSAEKICIGIDVGGTNLRFALVDELGKVLFRERRSTEIHQGKEQFLKRFFSVIASLRTWADSSGKEIVAIGAGVPGLISNDGIIYSSVNLLPLEGLNLRELITAAAGLPAIVVNDANASAWGEKCYGAGRSMNSFLMLTLGTGVGSGLVLNDKLWTGCDGVAGEFGHVTVEPDGKPCPCGNHGCLEQYASATALVAEAGEAIQAGGGGALANVPASMLNAEVLADAAHGGDALAKAIFENAGRYLGIASAAAVNLLNLEGIILGGGVAASYDLIVEPMRREILARAFAIPARRVRLVRAELEDDAGILGAAAMALASVKSDLSNE
ncbi:ROK family protein [Geotalea uraniireducens]|uniref:ROK family protein n=1 Tax=Geotalea uraniireducens (strain Rf4) TaxID=351605 RepID=A5G397_GEOUR|nr:ROK family protein [Geotalea uraniireducens]ABQ26265.1 ROK family protein [Geotalea uraniireducens Rf4]